MELYILTTLPMRTILVVLLHLALLATAESRPRRKKVGKVSKSMQFGKRDNSTDGVFPYTTQLSALSIRDITRLPKIAKRTGHGVPSAQAPSMYTIPLNHMGELWAAVVSIGKNEHVVKKFSVLVDTGSPDLWVFSSSTRRSGYVMANKGGLGEFKTDYRGTSVEGELDNNMVAFRQLRLDMQYFGAVTSMIKTEHGRTISVGGGFAYEGVLGLAFAHDNFGANDPSFLDQAVRDGKISPIFSIDPVGPTLYLGGIHAAYEHLIEWHNVEENQVQWIPKEQSHILVQGTKYGVELPIIDTGSSRIYGPPVIVKSVYENLGGQKIDGVWKFPCRMKPKVEIGWVTGKLYRIAFNVTPDERSEHCEGTIQEADSKDWTFGLPFLNEVYSAYDRTGKRVGFAPREDHSARRYRR